MANMPLSNIRALMRVKTTGDTQPEMSALGTFGHGGTIARQTATFHSVPDYRTGENFSQLKLTAEKMMQEEACLRSELTVLRTKFLKSQEDVRNLESKVLEKNNEIAMLKVEHNEDVKLWKGMESKILATSTFSDHLAETLTLLDSQLKEAEQSKNWLEEKLVEREKFYDDTKSYVDDMAVKMKAAQDCIKEYEGTIGELKDTLQQQSTALAAEIAKSQKLTCENDGLEQQLSKALSRIQEDKKIIESKTAEIQLLTKNLLSKAEDVTNLQNKNLAIVETKSELEVHIKDLQNILNLSRKDNEILLEKKNMLNLKISELEKANAVVTCTIENLHSEKSRMAEQADEDKKEQQRRVDELMQKLTESEKYVDMTRQSLREKTQEVEILFKRVTNSDAEIETMKDEVTRMQQECCQKQQLMEQMSQQEEDLRREIREMRENWTAAENAAKDLNIRFKHQLEAKQAELTIHLQEISLRNNQEMADMRRRYEEQTRDAAAEEKRKGEAALEAIKQASEQKLANELDAANQRLKSAQRDHEDMVRLIKQASEEEKEKIVTLHAEELRTKQQEFRAEIERRCGDVARAVQHENEELQKFQQEELTKLQARHDTLLGTAEEVTLLKDQMKKLKEDHKEDLAHKIQELNSKCDLLSREHEAEILRLESSSTRKIEEWKSKAVFWQIEFIKLRTALTEAVVVGKEGARSTTPLKNAEDVSTNEEASASQGNDQKNAYSRQHSKNNDVKLSRMLPLANSFVQREQPEDVKNGMHVDVCELRNNQKEDLGLKLEELVENSQHKDLSSETPVVPTVLPPLISRTDYQLKCADAEQNSQNNIVIMKQLRAPRRTASFVLKELSPVALGGNSQDKDANLLLRMPATNSHVQGELSARGSHIHRELRFKTNEIVIASSSHSAKVQRGLGQEQKVHESTVITRYHSAKKDHQQGDPNRFLHLENSKGNEITLKQSRRTKMVAEFPLIPPRSEGKDTVATRRRASSRVSSQDCEKIKPSQPCPQPLVDKSKRKSKRVKFNENQSSEALSKTLCELFKMEELMDPYDDPYVFNE